MSGKAEIEATELAWQYTRTRFRQISVIVMSTAILAGVAAGLRDPRWALLAAAVIFGWSQIGGA